MRIKTPQQGLELMTETQRQVKSVERVRDLGEVFTPRQTVDEMLNLLPKTVWNHHPTYTFLEPSCGDGNFLVAILERKLEAISKLFDKEFQNLESGVELTQFYGLEALSSIYAVDISKDNVVGGKPGHEIGARTRLIDNFVSWNARLFDISLNSRNVLWKSAHWIIEHNILVGNMLALDANGKPSGRDKLPIVEYVWSPNNFELELLQTTLGAVIQLNEQANENALSLFSPDEPQSFWKGKALSLGKAERIEPSRVRGPLRNGTGVRV